MSLILAVHHDADLYGADQSLLRTLRALRTGGHTLIVVLPYEGPLVERLRAEGFEVHLGPVGKLTRQVLRPSALIPLVSEILRSIRFIKQAVGNRKVDLAYTNTIAVVGCALWAVLNNVPRVWHVREIILKPKIAAKAFPLMLRRLGGWCICNSQATREWIVEQQPALAAHSSVIWNGLETVQSPSAPQVAAFRQKLGLQPHHVVATLVGRINRWKGQGVFIEAAKLLTAQGHPNLRCLIVGDVHDNQRHFREAMLQQIETAGLKDRVLWHPFTPDIDTVWAASQIAVVPSIDPEPFGRVAIEAMTHGLPVIASAHGGLTEIVNQNITGLLVTPGNARSLAEAISKLANSAPLRTELGSAGRRRQQLEFSQANHDKQVLSLFKNLLYARR